MTSGPWRRATTWLAVAGNLVALVGLLAAWYGAAGEVTVEAQVRWLNLGVISLVVSGAVTVAWLREARIRVTDESRRLLRGVRASAGVRSPR